MRDRLLIRFLFHLGCRISEGLGVRVEDIDLERGTVTIVHLKRQLRLSCQNCEARLGQSHKFCPACGNEVISTLSEEHQRRRMRTLPVDRETLEMLADYITRGGVVVRNGERLVFGINRHRAWQIIKQCADKANLPKLVNPETGSVHSVSPHKLRDAFAVHSVKVDDSGMDSDYFKNTLGIAALIPQPDTERSVEENIETGTRSYGEGKAVRQSTIEASKRWFPETFWLWMVHQGISPGQRPRRLPQDRSEYWCSSSRHFLPLQDSSP
jgi:integrase/recombinase XerD